MFITNIRQDVATKKVFTKKYKKLANIFSDNLEIMDFLYTIPPIMVMGIEAAQLYRRFSSILYHPHFRLYLQWSMKGMEQLKRRS